MTASTEFSVDAQISRATADLIYAVQHNMPRSSRRAVDRGANVHVTDRQQNNLLHIAPNAHIGAILIEHKVDRNARNNAGQTPLHTSMRRGSVNLTKLLILDNTDVNAQENSGITPLHLAENAAVNQMLLDRGANPNAQDSAGDTPLHLAIRSKGIPIISALLTYGADRAITNKAGDNAYNELQKLIQRTEKELANIARTVIGDPTLSSNVGTCDTNFVPNNAQGGGYSLPAFNLARGTTQTRDKQPMQIKPVRPRARV